MIEKSGFSSNGVDSEVSDLIVIAQVAKVDRHCSTVLLDQRSALQLLALTVGYGLLMKTLIAR